MPNTVRAALLAAALCAVAGVAQAHPELVKADPAVRGHVSGSPRALRITFSEPLVPAFSGAELIGPSGQAVKLGKPAVDSKDKRVLIVPITARLAPGTYTVKWHAVSSDTHRITGSYTFMVM